MQVNAVQEGAGILLRYFCIWCGVQVHSLEGSV